MADCNKVKVRSAFDESQVSSSGFLLNCAHVTAALFLELCESERQNCLDPGFWLQGGGFGWEKETPLSSCDAVQEYRAQQKGRPLSVSGNALLLNELGYIALSFFHCGVGGFMQSEERMEEQLRMLRENVDRLEMTREAWENTGERAMNVLTIQTLKGRIEQAEQRYFGVMCKCIFVVRSF